MRRKKTAGLAFLALAALLTAGYLCLPASPWDAVSRAGRGAFAAAEPIHAEALEDQETLVLYRNRRGSLCAAVTRRWLGRERVRDFAGELALLPSGPQESGATRISLVISWYDEGERYVCAGVVRDAAVARVVYGSRELEETAWEGCRILFGHGPGEAGQSGCYELYGRQGEPLGHWVS